MCHGGVVHSGVGDDPDIHLSNEKVSGRGKAQLVSSVVGGCGHYGSILLDCLFYRAVTYAKGLGACGEPGEYSDLYHTGALLSNWLFQLLLFCLSHDLLRPGRMFQHIR